MNNSEGLVFLVYFEGAAVKFGRRDGEGESLIPDGLIGSPAAFRFFLFHPLSVDHQVELHQRIFFNQIFEKRKEEKHFGGCVYHWSPYWPERPNFWL